MSSASARLRAFSSWLSGSGRLADVLHQKSRSRPLRDECPLRRHVGGRVLGGGATAPITSSLPRGSARFAWRRGWTGGSANRTSHGFANAGRLPCPYPVEGQKRRRGAAGKHRAGRRAAHWYDGFMVSWSGFWKRPLEFEGFPQLHMRYPRFRISRPVAITSSTRSNNVCRRLCPGPLGRCPHQSSHRHRELRFGLEWRLALEP